MEEVAAFIVAGGKSSRMGRDKAFLELAGKPLLEHMLQLAASVAPRVRIVGSAAKFAAWGEVVEDVFPERGPLGGIHAALSATASGLNLILAVDLPLVQPKFLAFLLGRAAATGALVTVPRTGGRFHPLCAVYRPAFRARAEEALRANRNPIAPLLQPGYTGIVEESELVQLSFPPTMFDNLNTPQQLAHARAAWDELHP
jgi:molybdopterin-guanine dinucleotide biosynthesis protein A